MKYKAVFYMGDTLKFTSDVSESALIDIKDAIKSSPGLWINDGKCNTWINIGNLRLFSYQEIK